MQKLLKNAIFSVILFVIIITINYFQAGKESTIEFIESFWWFFVLLPIAIRLYGWFQGLKRKASQAGSDAVDKLFDKKKKKSTE
ncbi:hypothetical protein BFP97_06140 [Roseivirga sp. 4D4]|uniref:hypothetical protein n=1 Tax=Roseivirga sp. 4D4 TaxID=1889784 RepID=UPI000853C3FF|nr:hypothetical protein [Roseivirga sp. 4D4]OEK01112.1 hypothetical protein BFP97_06140 [Roseivirga sp. 4D4]